MKFLTKKELRIFLIFWIIFSIFATNDRWNDNSSLDLTRAIVDEQKFEIDSYANNTGDRAYYNDHYYSDKVPGSAFLAVPFYTLYKFLIGEIPYHNSLDEDNPHWEYWLFLFLVISLISAVCGALTVVLVYKISKYFTSNKFHRNLILIVLGLGTLLPHAARQFNSHAISMFFIFLCFYLIFKMKKENKDYSLIAGFAGGFAILVEYRVVIILAGLSIIVLSLKKWKLILKFLVAILIMFSILLSYNYLILDSPFRLPVQYGDLEIWAPELFNNYELDQFYSCQGKIPKNIESIYQSIIKAVFDYNKYPNREKVVFNRFIRYLFYPFKGLFFYSPIILLSFLGLFFMYKQYKLETLILLSCFLIYTVQIVSFIFWWQGLSFGPRHLTPFIPFFMIPLIFTLKKLKLKFILFFIVTSILINIIGLQSPDLSHDPAVSDGELYCQNMDDYKPLANPLFTNYLPSFLGQKVELSQENHLILERLLKIKLVPIANMILIIFSFLLIWKNKSYFSKK